MSKLNFNRNIFLEKEELVNFQSFFSSDLLMKILLQASYSFGVISNNPADINEGRTTVEPSIGFNNPFEVQLGTVKGTIKVLPGMALTSSGRIISINVEDNITVPSDGLYYWVKIAYATRNYELGYVNINTKGIVSGTADFTGKVRGQSTSSPVYIRFQKEDGSIPLNNGNYQVVNIIDNQNLLLTSATTFVAESNLRPIVLGTLPVGGIFSKDQLEGLYTYDYYEISLINETSVNTPPEKQKDEFYISRVVNNGGSIVIDNTKKVEYWSLGNIYTGTAPAATTDTDKPVID